MATKKPAKKAAKAVKPAKEAKEPAKRGRPTKANAERKAKVIAALRQGTPLTIVCADMGVCDDTVRDWEKVDAEFSREVARAREEGVDRLVHGCIEIADDARNDFMEKLDAEGNPDGVVFNSEHVQRSKLRIETRLKLAACFNPRKYGPKQEINHKGRIGLEQLVAGEEPEQE